MYKTDVRPCKHFLPIRLSINRISGGVCVLILNVMVIAVVFNKTLGRWDWLSHLKWKKNKTKKMGLQQQRLIVNCNNKMQVAHASISNCLFTKNTFYKAQSRYLSQRQWLYFCDQYARIAAEEITACLVYSHALLVELSQWSVTLKNMFPFSPLFFYLIFYFGTSFNANKKTSE